MSSSADGPAFTQRSPPAHRAFTPRELEIAAGICRDLTYAEIGAELGIAGATVRVNVKSMALKLADIEGFAGRQRVLMWCRWAEWDEQRVLIRKKSGGP